VLVPLLASLASALDALALLPAVSIPIWNEYVNFIEWSLDSLANVFHSGALAIIVFTIIVKTLVLPLTIKSIRSSKAMQELAPKLKELQKKHGKDRQRISQETMALYQANNVNPMAGCLPMLVQIPIFLGVYQGIMHLASQGQGTSQYWGDGFLWLSSLGARDPFVILPIVAAIFQFIQTQMMRPANQGPIEDPQQRIMNSMMNFMPLMVIVFGFNFASGAVLYWATQSVYSVVQQWLITGWGRLLDWFPNLPELPDHRRLGYRPPREVQDPVVLSGGAPVRQKGPMGWLQARMEEAQRQAEARRDETAGGGAAVAEAAAPATAAGEVKAGARGRNPRARSKPGSNRAKPGAGANSRAAANGHPANGAANGSAAPATGNSRAVIVPRKAKPAPGVDGKRR